MKWRPAGVPESLLLAGPFVADIDRHPGGPGGVAAHLRAALQVADFILLEISIKESQKYLVTLHTPYSKLTYKEQHFFKRFFKYL